MGDILQHVGGLALPILLHPRNSNQLIYFKAEVRQQHSMRENVFMNNVCVLSRLTQNLETFITYFMSHWQLMVEVEFSKLFNVYFNKH